MDCHPSIGLSLERCLEHCWEKEPAGQRRADSHEDVWKSLWDIAVTWAVWRITSLSCRVRNTTESCCWALCLLPAGQVPSHGVRHMGSLQGGTKICLLCAVFTVESPRKVTGLDLGAVGSNGHTMPCALSVFLVWKPGEKNTCGRWVLWCATAPYLVQWCVNVP